MLRYAFILLSSLFFLCSMAQNTDVNAVEPDSNTFENVYVKKISEDSLHSTYIIWIKKGVREHYHAGHTEQVYVLEGEGSMTMGDSTFQISSGDLIVIPMGTVHSVINSTDAPLKVLSIQSPRFDGDRIWIKK